MAYFASVKRSWADVPVTEEGIDTKAFLEASDDLVKVFELFPAAFALVKSDMEGNIAKIRTRYEAKPEDCNTLENLVKAEKAEKQTKATQGLLWLSRGLDFTAQGFRRNGDNPEEELSVSFTKAYGDTLAKFHNFIIKGTFNLAMKTCPYRADLYPKLAPENELEAQLNPWLTALEGIITKINAFYTEGNYGKGL